jgi:drug/metabolite transporter (DMT)-like permease
MTPSPLHSGHFNTVGRSGHSRCCPTCHQTWIGTLAKSYCSCSDRLHCVSSAVLIFVAFVHDQKLVRRFDRRGALWFAAVGLCNGLSVLSLYAALGRGPVALVAPLVASYPLVTLLLSFVFLKHEHIGPQLVVAVAVIVGGVVLLIIA